MFVVKKVSVEVLVVRGHQEKSLGWLEYDLAEETQFDSVDAALIQFLPPEAGTEDAEQARQQAAPAMPAGHHATRQTAGPQQRPAARGRTGGQMGPSS